MTACTMRLSLRACHAARKTRASPAATASAKASGITGSGQPSQKEATAGKLFWTRAAPPPMPTAATIPANRHRVAVCWPYLSRKTFTLLGGLTRRRALVTGSPAAARARDSGRQTRAVKAAKR
jgi:hypothetical protein